MTTRVSFEKLADIYDMDELLDQFSASMRNHSRRVAICSAIISENANAFMGFYEIPAGIYLPVIAYLSGIYHDIGKLLLAVDNKDDYYEHPAIGADLLEKNKAELLGSDASALLVLDAVRYHHEQADGGGFPDGRKSRDIPIIAGICSLADRLDHYMYPENTQIGDGTKAFEALEAKVGKQICECAWICTERAWPFLMEKYDSWNNDENYNEKIRK